ncbi:MAG: PAS domain S-box protein [Deltaproteobacteria bacterium]|nr:PAS domain S-box protein [Deltaproteobacteria bacterium]
MNSTVWYKFLYGLYYRAGLKTRLIVLVLAIAVPLLVTAAISISSRALRIVEQDSYAQLVNTNHLLATSVSLWLDTHSKAFQYFVSQPDIVGMNAGRQKQLLEKMAAIYPYMYLLSTTDLSGMNVARSDEMQLIDYSDRFWFQQARIGTPVTFESVISKTIDKPGLVVSMPIKNNTGRIVGVGMFAMDLDNLSKQVRVTRLGKTGFAYLVDNRNRMIAHPDPTFSSKLRDFSTDPAVLALRQGKRGTITFKEGNGQTWLAHVDVLANGWGIVVQQKEAEVLSAGRFFQQMALMIIVGAVMILIVSSWWAVRQALHPIDILTQAVTGLASGKFSQSDFETTYLHLLKIRSRNDEIGMLADSFYKMAIQLQETLSSLQQELSEHKRVDAELERERSILSTILKNDPSGVVLIDHHGVFQYVNPEFTNITGYTLQDISTIQEWYQAAYRDPEYRQKVIKAWKDRRTLQDRRWDVEFTTTCKDGQTKDIEFRTAFIKDGEVTVLNDVTVRRRAEKALKESEGKYRNIFESAVEGIFQTTPEGRFINVNPAFSIMHGYESPREMIASINDIKHQLYVNPEDRIRFMNILEKKGVIEAFEVQLYKKDGGKIWVSLKARAVQDSEGTTLYYEGMAENITERKLVEEEVRQKNEQLRDLRWKLSEFEENERRKISRELHDLIGQNLAILGLNLNMLQTLIPDKSTDLIQSRLKDSLALVKQTTAGIRNLMADLRSPVLDDYGLIAAIRLYGDQCAVRAGIRVIVQGSELTLRLPGHIENAMFRIVQEALTNVIKHAQATEAIVNIRIENSCLYVTVTDNGIGYNRADIARRDKHRGWGLSTMMERALLVGGMGCITSNPGEGTCIAVEVPL